MSKAHKMLFYFFVNLQLHSILNTQVFVVLYIYVIYYFIHLLHVSSFTRYFKIVMFFPLWVFDF